MPYAHRSRAFTDGGVYVMRNDRDHVFIDCGPVGLAGRGGHGHNDLLSFEAVLANVPLVTEGGCYVYTADFASRNRDRATRSHNSPRVDGEEINRFPGPEFLWTLMPDAHHELVEFATGADRDRFIGRHDGYARLQDSVRIERTIELTHATHELRIADRFIGEGRHEVEVPLHLHPAVDVQEVAVGALVLVTQSHRFRVTWNGSEWTLHVEQAREATSYGRSQPTKCLVWRRTGNLSALDVVIAPVSLQSRAPA
jgi:uncharacterized heparinase superfamily protein